MEKTNTKKIQIWLICIICFLFACLLAVSVTAAYFGQNRKFEGTLEFAGGVKVDYFHVDPNDDKSFTLLKLGNSRTIDNFLGENDLTTQQSYINLMQIIKNYYNYKQEMGLFNTYKEMTNGENEEQIHDALEDAIEKAKEDGLIAREIFHLFKKEINKEHEPYDVDFDIYD